MDVPAMRSDPATEVVADWFDQHARALAGYATRRVGANLARDIVADTFRIALQQLDGYEPGRGGERAWLFGIASNLIRRHWRTEERRLRIQARSARADVQPVDPLLRVDERLDASAHYQRVVDAVATLDPDDRDLLILIAWEQFTSREAAAALGIPPGTVRSRLTRIRAQLAQIVRQGETDG
ncbi:putative RNA polymerase ECF subfamily sigma factor [Ilumatobacter coccineus YM16-304]|uniref:Putative RNA polymerase ECF subfamily sigma factor n=1 Tax=Ilumatobacter coccineus (strain NBRC 103263 / KCTC 29153 / YM16-304) TaxID=1313172 RepID=A0A6C7E4M2_ILUCY|nr:putative RNA polymerase ECF subfamily sigma factor [Ilumatobacter coccineus YM16-304]